MQQARDLLETAQSLQALPATEAAARRGELSGDQARAVTRGATADPRAEGRLLEAARRGSLGELKDEARRIRFGAQPDPEARRKKIFERRSLRTYADDEGAFHLHLTHTTDTGAKSKGAPGKRAAGSQGAEGPKGGEGSVDQHEGEGEGGFSGGG